MHVAYGELTGGQHRNAPKREGHGSSSCGGARHLFPTSLLRFAVKGLPA